LQSVICQNGVCEAAGFGEGLTGSCSHEDAVFKQSAHGAKRPATWIVHLSDHGPWRRRMNWEQVRGNWNQAKGELKKQWGKLTDDDLTQVNGERDKLLGRIQERYGYAKEDAERELRDWESRS
jgi:uncharacterized protein YjbJ (UPF0337 family)